MLLLLTLTGAHASIPCGEWNKCLTSDCAGLLADGPGLIRRLRRRPDRRYPGRRTGSRPSHRHRHPRPPRAQPHEEPHLRVWHAPHRSQPHTGALPLLPVRHPLPHLRHRGGVPLPLGRHLRRHRRVRLLRDAGVHRHPGLRSAVCLVEGRASLARGLLPWARKPSLWPMPFGSPSCAIEMFSTFMARHDLDRFGIVPWPSPRQSDVMIVSGTVTKKMAPAVKLLYEQMPSPKWVISMGACATNGAPHTRYDRVLQGVDKIIPVDVCVPGCPPRPEALMDGFIALQHKIMEERGKV